MAEPVLRVTGLTKSFRGKRAVDGVTLSVERGQIVGFLGPNGAGKTSVMNIVMGLLAQDSGQVELFGRSGAARNRSVRLRMGYLQEKPRIYPEMPARAYLRLFAELYGVPDAAARTSEVVERVGLADSADRPLGTYSRGMQQRACLARVMLHRPEFLILDEPTLGLDPTGVADMRDILREMRAAGTTLLFSSHQLAEIERICDSVVFLSQGRIIAAGRPEDLLPDADTGGALAVELHEPVHASLPRLQALPGVLSARETGAHRAEIVLADRTGDARDRRARLARALTNAGLTPLSVGVARASLEDLFLARTGYGPAKGD